MTMLATTELSTSIKTKKVNFGKSDVNGYFRLTDGTKTHFHIDGSGTITQWGNTELNLQLSVPFLTQLSEFLIVGE